jgi:hypothetical protein
VVAAPIEDHPSHRRRPLAADPHAGARLRERFEPAEGLGDLLVKVQGPSICPRLIELPRRAG